VADGSGLRRPPWISVRISSSTFESRGWLIGRETVPFDLLTPGFFFWDITERLSVSRIGLLVFQDVGERFTARRQVHSPAATSRKSQRSTWCSGCEAECTSSWRASGLASLLAIYIYTLKGWPPHWPYIAAFIAADDGYDLPIPKGPAGHR
jgi:hypothetical protein